MREIFIYTGYPEVNGEIFVSE